MSSEEPPDGEQAKLRPGSRVASQPDRSRRGTVTIVIHEQHRDRYLVRWDDGDVGELLEAELTPE